MVEHVNIDPKQAALIVVDVQNDYFHEEGYSARRGSKVKERQVIIPVIEGLIEQARECQIPIVFVQKTVTESDLPSQAWRDRPNARRKDAEQVKKGSWGAEFYKLVPNKEDIVIEKHRYSAFDRTNLHETLTQLQRKSLVIVGISTNVCVESTARHGFALDYNVTLVRDGCASSFPELGQASLRNIESYFGWVMDAKEILDVWKSRVIG